MEFFSGIDPYRIVQAEENPYLAAGGSIYENLPFDEWLTYVHGAKPVLNVAIGYSCSIKENLLLMTGFRTDFNSRKNIEYEPYVNEIKIKGIDLDLYHFSGGLILTVLGQDLITGLQYTIGKSNNQAQFADLSDPVEWDPIEKKALQGTRQNTMTTLYNSISFYFGATFNFGGGDGK